LDEYEDNRVIYLLLEFMNSYHDDQIKKLQVTINKEKNDNSSSKTFAIIIDYILTELHKELIMVDSITPIQDYDEKQAYKKFEEKYLKNNVFNTKDKFFGIKEMIRYNGCCGLQRYSFELIKYIYISSDILQKNSNLNECIKEWEKEVINEIITCDMCLIEIDSSVKRKIFENPGILIIILDDIDIEFNIKIENQIIINKCEYNLINCIVNQDYNNIIYKNQKWYILDKKLNYLKEFYGEIESLLKYTKVLFYEKVGKDVKNNNFENESGKMTEVFIDRDDTFYNNKEYDIAIDTSKSLEDVQKQVDTFLATVV
jgi:hypothetical protein